MPPTWTLTPTDTATPEPATAVPTQAVATIAAPLAVAQGFVYLASEDFYFYSINTLNGRIRWEFISGLPIRKKPQVIGENVFQKIQEGMPKLKAAIVGTREMAMPITFSILTTMVAFAPMLFVPGIMGKIFVFVPIIVILVLGFSLLESFFVLPAHLSHSKGGDTKKKPNLVGRFQGRVARGLELFTEKLYDPLLRLHIRLRYIVVALAESCPPWQVWRECRLSA